MRGSYRVSFKSALQQEQVELFSFQHEMTMELEEETREFLIECNEYMQVLDRDILLLEESPEDTELIANVFRAVHTIKGTCGFFGFDALGSLTHVVETILGQVRERERILTAQTVSLILEALDMARILLGNIETGGAEGTDITGPLRARLEEAAQSSVTDDTLESVGNQLHGYTDIQELSKGRTVTEREVLLSEVPSFLVAPAPAGGDLNASHPFRENGAVLLHSKSQVQEAVMQAPAAAATGSHPLSQSVHGVGSEKDTAEQGPRDFNKDAQLSESTIRVDVALLNRLMNLVGELVLARNQLLQDTSSHNPSLQQTSQRLNLITSELQEGVMKTRMQPIGVVWNKLPRVVRDLAAQCGKLVRIEMEGAGTELDKTIIEAIKDPLTHIVRNSCDHGIELPEVRNNKGKNPEGLLLLRAYHEGGVVNIEISDDGAGIDPQKVRNKAVEKGLIRAEQALLLSDRDANDLIFLPGFSTAAQISAVSGRGVGMDVVKTNIERIGGNVELLNRADAGTTIRIKIPLTLAIIPGLVIGLRNRVTEERASSDRSSQERFIIPQANLLELVRIEPAEMKKRVENVHGTPVFHHRGKLIPLINLGQVLAVTNGVLSDEAINIVVLQAESKQLGLVVDSIWDTQEIVVKPLGRQLKGLSCYVGATIMGDGRPALILDVAGLARLAGLGLQTRQVAAAITSQSKSPFQAEPQMLLLFQTIRHKRMAAPVAVVDRLEEVKLSEVQHSAGRPVLHYRGEILPLVFVDSADLTIQSNTDNEATLQVIVFANGNQRVGLVVERILDIVHEVITGRRSASAPNVLGSAVIGGKITDLLDLPAIIASIGENWLKVNSSAVTTQRKLLLVDASPFSREVIGERLAMSSYDVIFGNGTNDALLRVREGSGFDGIVLSTHGAEKQREEFLDAIGLDETLAKLPLVELVDELSQAGELRPFHCQLMRSDLSGLVERFSRLFECGAGKEAA